MGTGPPFPPPPPPRYRSYEGGGIFQGRNSTGFSPSPQMIIFPLNKKFNFLFENQMRLSKNFKIIISLTLKK
jgi:hypothetical protein